MNPPYFGTLVLCGKNMFSRRKKTSLDPQNKKSSAQNTLKNSDTQKKRKDSKFFILEK